MYTDEQNNNYIQKAIEKGVMPLEEYSGAKNSIMHKCMLCDKIFKVSPRAVYVKTGYGCRSCSVKYTHDEFENKLKNITKDIIPLEKYAGSKVKIKCKCLKDDYIWSVKPNDLLQGIGCPKCANKEKITAEVFMERFNKVDKNKNILLLSEYVDSRTSILCKCILDGYEWYARPYDLINGSTGCKKCQKTLSYTTDEFKDVLNKVNPSIEVIGEYINSKTTIECKCKVCNKNWMAIPANMINSFTGCPNCIKHSKIESLVEDYFEKHKIIYEKQKKFEELIGLGGKPLSYDFYLPEYNILIECQGKQHEQPIKYFGGDKKFQKQREHDIRKKEYALKQNIEFLEIWYYELNRIVDILNKVVDKKAGVKPAF